MSYVVLDEFAPFVDNFLDYLVKLLTFVWTFQDALELKYLFMYRPALHILIRESGAIDKEIAYNPCRVYILHFPCHCLL